MSLWDRPNGPITLAANSATQSALNVQGDPQGPLPVTQKITTTAETVILSSSGIGALLASLPPNRENEQTELDLVISGYIKTTNAADAITINIYEGTSTTIASDTELATSGSKTQNNATAPFLAHLKLLYDSVSGKLTGTSKFLINNTLVAEAALAAVVTGINNDSNPVASFLMTVTSTGAASGTPVTVNVQKFSVG